MKLFSNTINSLENSLNYSTLKQKVISQNIANVDTPNYKAKDVDFKNVFDKTLNQSIEGYRTNSLHYEISSSSTSENKLSISQRNNVSYNNNGNNVDIDKEMAELAENQIYYNALVDRLNGKFNDLKTVIRGGK